MPMNKKEKEKLEKLLTISALRYTADVVPDVPPPSTSDSLSTGFIHVGSFSNSPRVEKACSSSCYHSVGRVDKTDSQGARFLYSTELQAAKALRRAVEKDCADRLRKIDRMIEALE